MPEPTSEVIAGLVPTTTEVWPVAAGGYLIEKQGRSGSVRTASEYAKILRRFLATHDPGSVRALDVHLFAYGPGSTGSLPAPATICVRLAAVGGFLDFAVRMGLLFENVASAVRRPIVGPAPPRGPELGALRRLLAAIPDTRSGRRDRAIVLAILLIGLRRHEVLAIRGRNLALQPIASVTLRVKGGTVRRFALPGPVLEAMTTSLVDRGVAVDRIAAEDRVFEICETGFSANLRRYAAAAGVEGVSPHALRHSAAKLRRQAGGSIEDVANLLGHRSLATTARYLARLEAGQDRGWEPAAELLLTSASAIEIPPRLSRSLEPRSAA